MSERTLDPGKTYLLEHTARTVRLPAPSPTKAEVDAAVAGLVTGTDD